MDLSDNKIPFGLLSPKEQEHLRNWPHGVQVYVGVRRQLWSNCSFPDWSPTSTYRTKPAPKLAPVTQVHWGNDYGTFVKADWCASREEADKEKGSFRRIAVIRREWTEGQPPKYFTEEV